MGHLSSVWLEVEEAAFEPRRATAGTQKAAHGGRDAVPVDLEIGSICEHRDAADDETNVG
jgi:hypothetical protein